MGLFLGIDLGTTKTAAVLFDPSRPDAARSESVEHGAALAAPPGHAEQNMERLAASTLEVVARLPAGERARVRGVALTGQMHSVVLGDGNAASPVVTWQDARASADGTLELLREKCGAPICDGFAAATLGWLAQRGELARWRWAATPADALGRRMTGGAGASVIDPSNAAGWGLYDAAARDWNRPAWRALGVPAALLPEVVDFAAPVGTTRGWPALADGVPVHVALGDNQASILGSSSEPEREVFVTLGTGAQLSMALWPGEAAVFAPSPGVEARPFPGGRTLAAVAPLCGGRAWAWLVDGAERFRAAWGLAPVPRDELFAAWDRFAEDGDPASGLVFTPSFLGERHEPSRRAVLAGVTLDNLTPANLARALADGIARSLSWRLPAEWFARRRRVAGSGNALRRVKALRNAVEGALGLPVEILPAGEEAALGAARLAGQLTIHNYCEL